MEGWRGRAGGCMDGWTDGWMDGWKCWPIRQDSGEAKMFVMPHACGVFGDRPPELRMDGWTDGWRYRCICVCINMYTVVGGESGGELEWTSDGVINV